MSDDEGRTSVLVTKEGVAICSCNDGLRPVIIKVERTDEEAEINYEPVK